MATLFNNPHVALFFNQMTLGVMDKLELDETNANEWLVEYQGTPNAIYCMLLMQSSVSLENLSRNSL